MRRRPHRGRALALAALLTLAISSPAGAARAEVIERVVAVVNQQAVFLSELRRRAAPFLDRILQAPTQQQQMAAIEQLYGELLERMIQEALFIQAAEAMSVTVSRAEVDRAIRRVQTQSGLQDAQFWEAVSAQGFTAEQYRSDVQRQLLRLKVLNQRARGRVNITEEQVRERYDMTLARARRTARFTAAQLFFELPAGANATEVASVRARAAGVREGLHDADDFWAAGGMRLGTLSQGDLPATLEEALLGLAPGEISEPVRGPAGYHVFLLMDRQRAAASIQDYEQVRMQLYQQMMEEAMTQQEQSFLEELRRRAIVDIRL